MIKRENLISAVLISGTLILSGYAWYLYTHPESSGTARQQTEESLANAYIEALLKEETTVETNAGTTAETSIEESLTNESRETSFDVSSESSGVKCQALLR